MKKIGHILKSQSHFEYIGQVINPPSHLSQEDYELGKFVKIDNNIVGLIYDTEIFNPLSISLSEQKEKLEIFAPDLLNETDTLLKIVLLGSMDNNISTQNLPPNTMAAGKEITTLTDEEIKNFHFCKTGEFQIKYFMNLKKIMGKLNPDLFTHLTNTLSSILDTRQIKIMKILEKNLVWNNLLGAQS